MESKSYNTKFPFDQSYNARFAREGLNYFQGVENHKVLLLGCGNGSDCRYFVESGAAEVIGLDVCDDMGTAYQHPLVQYVKASAETMPFDTGSFDHVYSVATLEHVPDIVAAFKEIHRVTKPGGSVYVFASPLWNSREGHHMFGLFAKSPWIHVRRTKEQIVEYCAQTNLSNGHGYDIGKDIDFIFSPYFNRRNAAEYIAACEALPFRQVDRNILWLESDEHLTDEIARDLETHGISRTEALAVSHTLAARK